MSRAHRIGNVLGVALALLAFVLLSLSLAGASAAAGTAKCGSVTATIIQLEVHGVSCGFAKKFLLEGKRHPNLKPRHGYRCTLEGGGFIGNSYKCAHKRKFFTFVSV